ncbi:Ferric-chelate reductase 1 [Orchesella cincta]|uniref:Ferric-chelate reductase 1 n=1 Tax=Orchesella cincta TaxID=48709 RepID=A0A1D2MAZ0_ORCCI|nr:Ferric-chelate reductase 1 [Orchesella cincta]
MYGVGGSTGDVNARLSAMSERRIPKTGVFGWNPIYPILHTTTETVGAWDHFREDVSGDIDCHVALLPKYYTEEPYPDSGEKFRAIVKKDAVAPPATGPTDPTIKEPEPFLVLPGDGREKQHCYRLRLDKSPFVIPVPAPKKETIEFCDNPTLSAQITPPKCGGFGRGSAEPQFHDGYGVVNNDANDPEQTYPWTLFGSRTEAYVIRDGALDPNNWKVWNMNPTSKLYWGTEPKDDANELDFHECETQAKQKYGRPHKHIYAEAGSSYDIKGHYGLRCSDGAGRRVLNLPSPYSGWPNTLSELWKLPSVTGASYYDDRCYCPRIPPTPDPRYIAPPITQIQGRRQHAYQMIIAWNCMVPFGFFVSRYYKETYSKVFFLQEYWWYTIHVLCMCSAAMFTFGGIYVMELKRIRPINWDDPQIATHVILGSIVIFLFFVQVFTGFFRVRELKKRIVNIFTHWFLGVLEYILAGLCINTLKIRYFGMSRPYPNEFLFLNTTVACMINSAFILLASMTCSGFVALIFLIIFQILFYASMEIHMRNVDKLLKLKPPRSYLPPPIMRLFHKDAPDAKFRIYVLIAYALLCAITTMVQYITMESNKRGESCFQPKESR